MRLGMRRKHSVWRFIMPALCLFFIIGVHKLLKRAEPVFYAECSNYSNTAFTELVNRCVLDELNNHSFSGFFKTTTDSSGKITSVEAEAGEINKVRSELMINVQNTLNNDYPAYVKIPLGSLSKYSLLSYMGPKLKITIIPISVVNSELEETFESAGINQVRHKLYLKLTVDMLYRGYLMDEKEKIETTIPLAETVIAGEVPKYYGNGGYGVYD